MFQRSYIKSIILPILIVFILAFFVVYFWGGYNSVSAQWSEPSAPPPINNVSAPLRIDTVFSGQVTGIYNNLSLNGGERGFNCASNDSIIWDGTQFVCDSANSNSNLLDVLNNGSDASDFVGGIKLGNLISPTSTWMDLGGAFTAKWIHATSTIGQSVIAHNLRLGSNLLTQEDVYLVNKKSLRIDQEGASTFLYIGNYADGKGFSHTDGDKANLFVEGLVEADLLRADSLCVKDGSTYNCINSFNGVGGAVFKQLSSTTSNGNVGGYVGANKKCPSGMHVCTVEEILNTINKGLTFPNIKEYAWISGGAPGHFSTGNDCSGWTDGSSEYLGRVWDFGQSKQNVGVMTPCKSSIKFACCQ